VNPGLIDAQVAPDVVNGGEQAYAEIAKKVPIGRAGRPEEIASTVLLRRRSTPHRGRRDDGAMMAPPRGSARYLTKALAADKEAAHARNRAGARDYR
jgi:NAD(P)-dependent dehydrogenase (short-subunit alcohol dehydrogenase family)